MWMKFAATYRKLSRCCWKTERQSWSLSLSELAGFRSHSGWVLFLFSNLVNGSFHAGRDISPALLRKIARDIGLTVDEFMDRG